MNPCCFLSLRTGALLIGIVEIVLYGLGTLLYGFSLARTLYAHSQNSTAVEVALQNALADETDPSLRTDVKGVFVILTLMTILSVVQVCVAIVLVVGVKKSSQTLLKAWIGVKVLVIMFSLVILIVSLLNNYSDLLSNASDTISCLIGIYCILVVYAFAEELKKGGTGSTAALHRGFRF